MKSLACRKALFCSVYTWQAYESAETIGRRIPFARQCLLLCESRFGPEHPDTLASVNNPAELLPEQWGPRVGGAFYRRALEAREWALGPEHPDTLTSVNNLAALLSSKGDYATAEPLYRRALEARGRVLGPEHSDTVDTLRKLTRLLAKANRRDESAALQKEDIARMTTTKAFVPPLVLRQLALECYRDGDYPHAEQLLRRVLEAHSEAPRRTPVI